MKKLLLVVIAVISIIFAMSFVGCNNNKGGENSTPVQSEEESEFGNPSNPETEEETWASFY